jgi:glycolate oxidase
VARGAGTGVSGGARPLPGAVVISVDGMTNLNEVAPHDLLVVSEPGVTNAAISEAVAGEDLYYAPDPSSRLVCTIGGNLAENAGGAHCLKYGFTTHHVLGVEVVTPVGDTEILGGPQVEVPGYDLRGVFVGSEGTLGIATNVWLRVLPCPQEVQTALIDFPSLEMAGLAVADVIGAGIVPACLEIMDELIMRAASEVTGVFVPTGAAAALIVECDGPTEAVEDDMEVVIEICRSAGAGSVHMAADPADREHIWRLRASAFDAVSSLAPDCLVQDGVVPRTSLGPVLAHIGELAADAGLQVANVVHAGDGNLHPLVLFDGNAGETGRAKELAAAISALCVSRGGSLTGEHGVGNDKACLMPIMFSDDSLVVMNRVRRAFDPTGLCNPDKIFPTPRLCGEPPGRYRRHAAELSGAVQRW